MNQDIFFELGTEELPSALVKILAKALLDEVLKVFNSIDLSYGDSFHFASPRRIAFLIKNVPLKQADRQILRKGPAENVAHDASGEPTQALLGFARSLGVKLDDLVLETEGKNPKWVYTLTETGLETKLWFPQILNECLTKLPIPKLMRWGSQLETFARPVHWVILLQGAEVIEASILGLSTNRISYGHRFMHPQALEIPSGELYEASLMKTFVITDFLKRRQAIVEQIDKIAKDKDFFIPMDNDLLDEMTSINEWPTVMLASFDEEFLEVPAEVLKASMQGHQKCLPVYDKKNQQLCPYFILVSNIKSKKPDAVRMGNEKVMRARLSDAAFFFAQDRKRPLIHYASKTNDVLFEKNLGSLAEKTKRVKAIVMHLIDELHLNKTQALRAVDLSKCDLMTGLVNEFPELQGIIGAQYAKMDEEPDAVSKALFEQYLPRFSGDELPNTDIGFALSLADRLDTLVGIFAVGLKPSGEKDPYKLRRHALAIVRMLSHKHNTIDLNQLLTITVKQFDFLDISKSLVAEIKQFIIERTKNYYQQQNYPIEWINSALMVQNSDWYDLSVRLSNYKYFMQHEQSEALFQSSKRVRQILAQTGKVHGHLEPSILIEPAEKLLLKAIQSIDAKLKHLIKTKHYTEAFEQLSHLAKPLEHFFEHVFVMVDDEKLRFQRLLLLTHIYNQLQSIVAIGL
jgi:glycyl-tRNA synthetase beta chain